MQHPQRNIMTCRQYFICYEGIHQYWIEAAELSNVNQPRRRRVKRDSVPKTTTLHQNQYCKNKTSMESIIIIKQNLG